MTTMGIIFANIYDSSLGELTNKRTMASLPYGGRYRQIDFSLSNMTNSGIRHIGIITKYNSDSSTSPLANATVVLRERTSQAEVASTVSGADGSFSISITGAIAADGKYQLVPTHAYYKFAYECQNVNMRVIIEQLLRMIDSRLYIHVSIVQEK